MISYTQHVNNVQSLAEYLLTIEAPSEIIRNLTEISIYCNKLEMDAMMYHDYLIKFKNNRLLKNIADLEELVHFVELVDKIKENDIKREIKEHSDRDPRP